MSGRGRRRRRGRPSGDGQPNQQRRETAAQSQGPQNEAGQGARRSRNRRRRGRRGGGGERQPSSPKSSEDLVRALPRERPETLTLPPDGTTLEQVIGDLQSEHGVPQYPQEFRITLKVAEERDRERTAPADAPAREAAEAGRAPAVDVGPRREKAPALGGRENGAPAREGAPGRRRKRGRRRRKRGGGGGGPESPPATPPSS